MVVWWMTDVSVGCALFWAQVSCYSTQWAEHKVTFLIEFGAWEDVDLSLDFGKVVAVRQFSSWRPLQFWRNFLLRRVQLNKLYKMRPELSPKRAHTNVSVQWTEVQVLITLPGDIDTTQEDQHCLWYSRMGRSEKGLKWACRLYWRMVRLFNKLFKKVIFYYNLYIENKISTSAIFIIQMFVTILMKVTKRCSHTSILGENYRVKGVLLLFAFGRPITR